MLGRSSSRTDVLWVPPLDGTTALERFGAAHGFHDYESLWKWSVTDLEAFWAAVWDWCGVIGTYDQILSAHQMPGARWFEGATVNYAEHMLRGDGGIIGRSQTRDRVELSADELRRQVAACRTGLARLGVGVGDRVVAYLPNIPEAVVAYLATASLGAIWSSTSPEFGTQAVLDRFGQIEPKVLFAVDGYVYGDDAIDRSAEVAAIAAGLPTVEHVVRVPYLNGGGDGADGGWGELLAVDGPLDFVRVPADHPLHVLYSSGATGLPKAIVHGHGGILVEHLKLMTFHIGTTPDDTFTWFTTTAWMMWNVLVSGLLTGSTIVTFDGDPGAEELGITWRVAAEERVTWFGTSAPFILSCRRDRLEPASTYDLSSLRAVGSTGAPLPAEGFRWVRDRVKAGVPVWSSSGGTDICSGFVGGSPMTPVRAGEISVRNLGAAVEAIDGELVVTEPMPSMPLGFWGDDDGSRYHEAYFSERPGVWTHGDLLEFTKSGGLIISGRSDATLNRRGVRIGAAELYRVVEGLPGVTDSLVVHHQDGDRLILFVAADESAAGDIEPVVKDAVRSQLSPRHVPNEVYTVPAIPTTLSGKKLEVPVKKILAGAEPDEVASRGSLRDPAALDAIVEVAATRNRRLRWDEASRAFAGEGETPRPVSRRREEMLELAAEMFAEHGFTGVTVDSLGSAAGVSGPALYHHFDSKEAMLGEMLVGISHHLLDRGRALHDADLGDRLLTELVAMHVDFAVDHQALILVHLRDLNQAHADDQRRVRLLQRQYTEVWVEALLEHTPDLPPDTARAAIHGVLGLINSTPFSPRAERDEMVRLLQEMAGAALAAVRPADAPDTSPTSEGSEPSNGRGTRLDRLRSLLFAPATNEPVLRKIGTRGADAVVIDCEDATPPHLKEAARESARTLAPVLTAEGTVVTVRVNAPSSEWFADDIATALTPSVAAVVVPKIERVDEIDELARLLDAAGLPELGVIAGIETALGVADARQLLAHPRIVAGYFGAEDFIADMGGRRTAGNAEVAHARGQVALAGRLAGVPLLDQVVTDFSDDERFLSEAGEAYSMGYAGKLCIHPRQVELANEAFQPSPDEVARAERLLAAYDEAQAAGRGAIAFEGQMVDEPLAAQARRIVEQAR